MTTSKTADGPVLPRGGSSVKLSKSLPQGSIRASTASPGSPVSESAPGRLQAFWIALPAIIIVLVAYTWLVSIGTWNRWPSGSTYYDQLASAFSHGHLWLDRKPDATLLALTDPYDPDRRKGLPFLSDASLYNGRYYLYFGPVPALFLVVAKLLHPGAIPDQYLVFGYTAGVFLVMVLFVLKIWRRFFRRAPAWIVSTCIVGVGLVAPFGWVLGSRAAVHDTAIAAGQFFFLAGLYAAFESLDGPTIKRTSAVMAGLLWAAAIGSRITQILPIGFMLFALAWSAQIRQVTGMQFRWSPDAFAFVVPPALLIVALGWYNWARFGSVLETGISYQLALPYLQRHSTEFFSVKYLIQNLYNYVLMPPKLRFNFPYVWPQLGVRRALFIREDLPAFYFAEGITGLLYTTPFLVFASASAFAFGMAKNPTPAGHPDAGLLQWLEWGLAGSFITGCGLFLVFFWAAERYQLDFMPAALLLSVVGFWRLDELLRSRRAAHLTLVCLAVSLLLVSVVVSGLLAIALNADGFKQLNPILWQQLNNVFRP